MIPHNETHRFLEWGPADKSFDAWICFFEDKQIPHEVAYNHKNGDVTIYKHMMYTDMGTGKITLCCIEHADEFDIDWYGEGDGA